MATYRFDKFQAAMVADGTKRRTIRKLGRRHPEPGGPIRLTTGRPHFEFLLDAVCEAVLPVTIRITRAGRMTAAACAGETIDDLDAFARLDGFEDAAHMGESFLKWHGPGKFRGVMIRW